MYSSSSDTPVATPCYPLYPLYPSAPSAPSLTRAIHDKTEALLREMESVADRTLGKKVSLPARPSPFGHGYFGMGPSSVPINLDFSNRSWNWGNRSEVHHHPHAETDKPKTNSSSSNNHTATRIALGVAGFIGAGIASYWIGKTCAQGEDANRASATYEDLKNSWEDSRFIYLDTDIICVNRLIRLTDSLKGREKRDRIQNLALFVLMFIAGAAAVGGAIVRSRFLVISAIAIGAFTLLAALFKYGYSSFSKGHLEEAADIQRSSDYLRKSFLENYNVTE